MTERMFTGIVQTIGKIGVIEPKAQDASMKIEAGALDLSDTAIGDSIAVSGVCLTVRRMDQHAFWVDVSGETLACSTFDDLKTGDEVNLEKSLLPTTRLGGHLVSGHVDGVGEIVGRGDEGRSVRLSVRAPRTLAKYIAAKGSICIDGVSLTVNGVDGRDFDVNIIPHTLEQTTIKRYRVGTRVNLEVDRIARYLERLLLGERAGEPEGGGISREILARHGYLSPG